MKQMSFDFDSRRSMVVARRGMVGASNPLAAQAGLDVLKQGGNAADAAVAAGAVMNVVAPASTGIGGDVFALYYDAKTKKVTALNGTGRAPKANTIEHLKAKGITEEIPLRSVHAITVPGAAQAWHDLIEKFGTMTLKDVLQHAIYYASEGYGVSPAFGAGWQSSESTLQNGLHTEDYLPDGKAPAVGQVVKLEALAETLRAVSEDGPKAFYEGAIADAIVETIQSQGGVMTHEDLKNHTSTWGDPISIDYGGVTVMEHPPNGQGLAALIAMNIAKEWDLGQYAWDSPQRLHLMIEAMRLAFADIRQYVADPAFSPAPLDGLLSDSYAKERRAMVAFDKAMQPPSFGTPMGSSNTIYLCAVDGEGNACSFINSLFHGWGSSVVAKGTGVMLQNRGAGFVLDPNHANALEGGKRPYHTIIPGMALKDGELYCPFGVMGGDMQPQGHFQVMSAMIDDDLNPQDALNRPRWQVLGGQPDGTIALEEGISVKTMATLAAMGHKVQPISGRDRGIFGAGQIIRRDPDTGVLYGGSEPRKDGLIAGY